ncbi:hypothetical protein Tco_0836358 [Tanacetum coccineum]
MSWIDSFVPMDSKVVKGSKDRAEGSETRAEGSSKRAGEDLQQESAKKQNMDYDKEKEELKQCFEIVLNDGVDVTIDVTPLSVKIPIVDYKIYQEGKKSFFQIIRADGKTQMYLTFSKMLKNFDREDLEVLWRIVKARFKKMKPVDYMDTFLLLTLKTMFEHHVEDEVWKRQQGLVKVLNWKLFDSCGVHCVTIQSIMFYLLVEKMFTWVKFLCSKDETTEFIIKFLKQVKVCLNATVRNIRTVNGTEFVNQTLRSYYEDVRISHQTSIARSPQ